MSVTAALTTIASKLPQSADATSPDDRKLAVSTDGFLFDIETGEVVGFANEEHFTGFEPPARFEIRDADGVDWVLERMSEAEAQIIAVEKQEDAILANLGTRKAWQHAILKFLHWRFGRAIEAQAREDLVGSKRKTMVYPHGQVAFRQSKGSVEILDQDLAARFTSEWAPQALKITVGVTGLQTAIAAYRDANDEEPDLDGVAKLHGPSEKVAIRTGVLKKGGDE